MNATLAQAVGEEPLWVQALLVGGILLVIASLFMVLRNRKRHAGAAVSARDRLELVREGRGPARDHIRQRDQQRKDLESVALSIEEMARRVGAQLDNKASRVEALLDEAERTIRRLESAALAAQRRASMQPADRGTRRPLDGRDPRPELPEPLPGAGAGAGADDLSARVRRLAADGLAAPAIAAEVDEHVGKVELILALARE